jgi:hypothetical protein
LPFAKTWSEEIVAEWLQLNGYVVEIGLPAAVTTAGGRFVPDIVGAKITGNTLEIVHIEAGQLSRGQTSISSLQKKFSQNICSSVEAYFRQRLGFTAGNKHYRKMYIATFWTKPVVRAAKKLGIDVHPMPNFICTHILPTIKQWKQHPPQQSRTKGSFITLPEAHWLLQLVDYLWNYKLFDCSKSVTILREAK